MEKILVIEDSLEVQQNIVQLLEMKGYRTVCAENGRVGLEVAQKEVPDLIVCDVMMPVMDGYGLLSELKNSPATAAIPFIFLTAKAERTDIRKGMIEGADDYLTKPFKAKDLFETVEARLKIKKKNDKTYDEMYNNISTYIPHELRTPLVAILGFSDLIIDNYDTIQKQDMIEIINRIKVAGKRLHTTIEKFILFSEIEVLNRNGGRNTDFLNSSVYLCRDLIEEIINREVTAPRRLNDIELKMEEKEACIWEEHLNILIKELVENAVKFSSTGDKIFIRGYVKDEQYCFEIEDRGRGMTRAEIAKLRPFIQHKREQYQQNGNGLGLATVQKIIELYKGSFSIESEEQNFTLVKFVLNIKCGDL